MSGGTGIEIASVAGLATVQDPGRPGRMHEGVPPGGALVPDLLTRANRALGNADDAAAIELIGSIVVVARGGVVAIATEEGEVRTLGEGASWRVEKRSDLRVRYVAVGGGIDVPRVLGGRGTLLVAGIGGVGGRGLRRGDRVSCGEGAVLGAGGPPLALGGWGNVGPLRVVVGPDDARFAPGAIRALLGEPFTVSPASDRTGSRLLGPPLPRLDADSGASAPMVAGAIEVPASGEPIVLGPDHPTTGGYPVLAVILRADLGRFHALPIGAPVRFARTDVPAPGRV